MGMFDYVYLDFKIPEDFLPPYLPELPKEGWQTKSFDRNFDLYIVAKNGDLYRYRSSDWRNQKEILADYFCSATKEKPVKLTQTVSLHRSLSVNKTKKWIHIDLEYIDGLLTIYNVKIRDLGIS